MTADEALVRVESHPTLPSCEEEALAAEVRALREELDVTHAQYERLGDAWEKQGDELTALRYRQAEAVEAAFREVWLERGLYPDICPPGTCDMAWQQSDAKKSLT